MPPEVVHQKKCRPGAIYIDLFVASWVCKDWSSMKLGEKKGKKSLTGSGETAKTFWELLDSLDIIRPMMWCGENLEEIAELSAELAQHIKQARCA